MNTRENLSACISKYHNNNKLMVMKYIFEVGHISMIGNIS